MTLKDKYLKHLADGTSPRLSKVNIDELNTLRQEHFHKNIDRSCKDCIKQAFLEVGKKLWKEESPVIKKQTFPEHKPAFKAVGNTKDVQTYANLFHKLKHNSKFKRFRVKTAFHYNCNEVYLNEMNKRDVEVSGYSKDKSELESITNKKPKAIECDLLVFLEGTKSELEKVLAITKCKVIHTHIELENDLNIRPKLSKGRIYARL